MDRNQLKLIDQKVLDKFICNTIELHVHLLINTRPKHMNAKKIGYLWSIFVALYWILSTDWNDSIVYFTDQSNVVIDLSMSAVMVTDNYWINNLLRCFSTSTSSSANNYKLPTLSVLSWHKIIIADDGQCANNIFREYSFLVNSA